MLKWIELTNFKSFESQRIDLSPFTLLIGANASGKSNLFDAIRVLQGLASDLSLADVLGGKLDGGRQVWPGIRGGGAEIIKKGATEATISTGWILDGIDIEHSVTFTVNEQPHISKERLWAKGHGDYLFDTHAPTLGSSAGLSAGGAINVAVKAKRIGGGGRSATTTLSSLRGILRQIRPVDRIYPEVLNFSQKLSIMMSDATFLDITPSKMRGYTSIQMAELGAEGENISSVLFRLCNESDESRQALLEWLTDLCAPELHGIDFIKTDLNDVILQFVESDGEKISARSLSDGTLRFLGEVVALLTAPHGSTLFVEEIENGLHPARSYLLADLYERMTRERGIQVIATTHSPKLLESLSEQTLKQAVIFARTTDRKGTVTSALGNLPEFHEVNARRGIDYLFTTRWLERSL